MNVDKAPRFKGQKRTMLKNAGEKKTVERIERTKSRQNRRLGKDFKATESSIERI